MELINNLGYFRKSTLRNTLVVYRAKICSGKRSELHGAVASVVAQVSTTHSSGILLSSKSLGLLSADTGLCRYTCFLSVYPSHPTLSTVARPQKFRGLCPIYQHWEGRHINLSQRLVTV